MRRESDFRNIAYEILRLGHSGWHHAGFGDARDPVSLPREVRERLAEGQMGKFKVNGVFYWIRSKDWGKSKRNKA